MLIEVQGDLLTSDCNVIAHGCNCFHTMGSGIARQIASFAPKALIADKQTLYGDKTKLGCLTYAYSGPSGDPNNIKCVVNLYTQYKFGTDKINVDYNAVATAMINLRQFIQTEEQARARHLKVGIPRIGCGLAGGDWKIVKPLIEAAFHDHPIYVYSL